MSVRRVRGHFPLKTLLCLSDRYNLACLAPNGVHWFSAYLRRWALLATQLEPMIRAIIQGSNLQLHYLPRIDAKWCVLLVFSQLQLGSSHLDGHEERR